MDRLDQANKTLKQANSLKQKLQRKYALLQN